MVPLAALDESERCDDEEENADDLRPEQEVVAEEDRPVRSVGRERQRDVRVDAVGEEGDDRGGRDEGAGARERGDHARAPRRGDALRGRERRQSERERPEHRASDGRPDAEVAGPLGWNRVRQRGEHEARRRDQEERAGEHEVVEALALPETAVDEVRDEERDQRRRGLERDMELRARVGECEPRNQARCSRQRSRGAREGQGEEPDAHSREEIGTPSPSA